MRDNEKTALIVLARSPADGISLAFLENVANVLQHRGVCNVVRPAYLELDPPLLLTSETLLQQGIEKILVLPFVFELDRPTDGMFRAAVEALPVPATLLSPIGFDGRLASILAERVLPALEGVAESPDVPILTVEGLVEAGRRFTYRELQATPGQESDVGRIVPGRVGTAVRVGALLEHLELLPDARRVIFQSGDSGFSATVDLDQALDRALLVYKLYQRPLPEREGGPLRLLIPDTDDRCENVKGVVRMEIIE